MGRENTLLTGPEHQEIRLQTWVPLLSPHCVPGPEEGLGQCPQGACTLPRELRPGPSCRSLNHPSSSREASIPPSRQNGARAVKGFVKVKRLTNVREECGVRSEAPKPGANRVATTARTGAAEPQVLHLGNPKGWESSVDKSENPRVCTYKPPSCFPIRIPGGDGAQGPKTKFSRE